MGVPGGFDLVFSGFANPSYVQVAVGGFLFCFGTTFAKIINNFRKHRKRRDDTDAINRELLLATIVGFCVGALGYLGVDIPPDGKIALILAIAIVVGCMLACIIAPYTAATIAIAFGAFYIGVHGVSATNSSQSSAGEIGSSRNVWRSVRL